METALIKLLDMSVVSSVVICIVLLLRVFLRKVPAFMRCLLWGLVGIRLLMPVGIESSLSLVPSSAPVSTYVESITEQYAPVINETEDFNKNSETNAPPASPNVSEKLPEGTFEEVNDKEIPWTTILFFVWISGVALMLSYMLGSYAWMRFKVKGAIIYDDRVRICHGDMMPLVIGVIAPKIYLPGNLSKEQANCIMLHESAHIKRGDHLIKPLAFLLLAVHWFNPLVWIAYLLLSKDIELACDEKVIKDMSLSQRKLYSKTLLMCSARRFGKAIPLAFSEVGVKERIKKVLYYKKPSFWIICTAVIAVTAVGVFFLTNPKNGVTLATEEGSYAEQSAEESIDSSEESSTDVSADASLDESTDVSADVSVDANVNTSEDEPEESEEEVVEEEVTVLPLPYQSTHETPENITQTYVKNDQRDHILDKKHPSYVIVWDKENSKYPNPPIEKKGMKIWLCDANGNKIDYVYTNSNGIARFEITVEGTYTVRYDGDEKYESCAPAATYYVTNDLGTNYAILGSDPSVMEKYRNNTINMYLYDKNKYLPLTIKTYDASTGKPLGNVTVTGNYGNHFVTVGANGSVTTAPLAAYRSTQLVENDLFGPLTFNKDGYDPCEIDVYTNTTLVEAYLSPITEHPYTIKILDQKTREPVEGVKLIVNTLGDNSVIYTEVSGKDGILSGMKTSKDMIASDSVKLCYEVYVPTEHGTTAHGIAWCTVTLNKEQSEYLVYLVVGSYPNDISLKTEENLRSQ